MHTWKKKTSCQKQKCFTVSLWPLLAGQLETRSIDVARWQSADECSPLHITCFNIAWFSTKMFSDDNLFTAGRRGGVKSCSLTLLPPPAKLGIDETSPCTWHSKVNRLFNSLSWHAYEVWTMLLCLLLMKHLFFICSEEQGKAWEGKLKRE